MLNFMWGVLAGWVSMIGYLVVIGLHSGSINTLADDEGE